MLAPSPDVRNEVNLMSMALRYARGDFDVGDSWTRFVAAAQTVWSYVERASWRAELRTLVMSAPDPVGLVEALASVVLLDQDPDEQDEVLYGERPAEDLIALARRIAPEPLVLKGPR